MEQLGMGKRDEAVEYVPTHLIVLLARGFFAEHVEKKRFVFGFRHNQVYSLAYHEFHCQGKRRQRTNAREKQPSYYDDCDE